MEQRQAWEQLEQQLRRDHPDCLVQRGPWGLTARMELGEVRVDGETAEFFLAGERLDARPLQQDGLYPVMDAFFRLMRELTQQNCSPVFYTAAQSLDTLTRRVAAGMMGSMILLMTLLLRLAPTWSLLSIAAPFLIGMAVLRLLGGRQLRRLWVCPRCGARLPVQPNRFLPFPQYAASCLRCGHSLLAPEALRRAHQLLEQSRPDGASAAGPAPSGRAAAGEEDAVSAAGISAPAGAPQAAGADGPFSIPTTKGMDQKAAQGLAVHRPDPPPGWQPEDPTWLHRHLKAGRVLLALALLWLAAGTLLPFTPMMLTRLSSEQLISLLGLGAVPLTVYLLVMAPVLRDRLPQGATPAWRAMHIRFPCRAAVLLALLAFLQLHYYWARFVYRVADQVLFYFFVAVLAIGLILVLCWRASKALRSSGSLFPLCLMLILLAYGMVYSGSLALCGPPEYFPAEITAVSAPAAEDQDDAPTLTVRLPDGTQMRCEVSASLLQKHRSGTLLTVCQRKGPLGLRMIRLLALPAP